MHPNQNDHCFAQNWTPLGSCRKWHIFPRCGKQPNSKGSWIWPTEATLLPLPLGGCKEATCFWNAVQLLRRALGGSSLRAAVKGEPLQLRLKVELRQMIWCSSNPLGPDRKFSILVLIILQWEGYFVLFCFSVCFAFVFKWAAASRLRDGKADLSLSGCSGRCRSPTSHTSTSPQALLHLATVKLKEWILSGWFSFRHMNSFRDPSSLEGV